MVLLLTIDEAIIEFYVGASRKSYFKSRF